MKYDYMIVGAGLFGATFAQQAAERGQSVLVIDQRSHVAGNCHTPNIEGILRHEYGPHIFHTNSDVVWEYVNRFAKWGQYCLRVKALYQDRMYSLPINLNTLREFYGVNTPEQARKLFISLDNKNKKLNNLEDWAIATVGAKIYFTLIKGYTTKQWGRSPRDLPISIIKRLPIRFSFDDNYFDSIYQAIPIKGYTCMVENMLDHPNIEIKLNESYSGDFRPIANKLVYTGGVDQYAEYAFGPLEYRSLRFEHRTESQDQQGTAIVNYTDEHVPWTRQIEHRHFAEQSWTGKSILTKEYSCEWSPEKERYYPIANTENLAKLAEYQKLVSKQTDVLMGGRLGKYQYWDMDQTIASALKAVREFR